MNPYDPHELDRLDPELDRVARQLEEHAAGAGGEPALDLPSRIWAAIEDEPAPASRWAWVGGWRGPARALAAGAVVVAAVTGAIAIGALIDRARPDVGGPPTPAIVPSPSESPSAQPTLSPSPIVTPTLSPSATPSPTVAPATPRPTPSDDEDEIETPEPSESDDDNSGPGGGGSGGDNSGPGGGGGDD
jgi:hypothetical protein